MATEEAFQDIPVNNAAEMDVDLTPITSTPQPGKLKRQNSLSRAATSVSLVSTGESKTLPSFFPGPLRPVRARVFIPWLYIYFTYA